MASAPDVYDVMTDNAAAWQIPIVDAVFEDNGAAIQLYLENIWMAAGFGDGLGGAVIAATAFIDIGKFITNNERRDELSELIDRTNEALLDELEAQAAADAAEGLFEGSGGFGDLFSALGRVF